MSLEAVFTYV